MIFMIFIFISLVLFVYFKVQQSKGRGPMEKRWHASKGSMAIGVFFISYSINSYLNFQSTSAAIVLVLFVLFGIANVIFGLKQYRHHLPFAKQEIEAIEKENLKNSRT